MKKDLSAARVRELLHYDPDTGIFTTLTMRGLHSRWPAGKRAGYPMSHGYRAAYVDGKSYLEHRLAWLYMTGEWPPHEVDHINLDRADNRWQNLRPALHRENTRNHPGHAARRVGKFKGTTPHGDGRWRAQIMVNRKQIYLGIFITEEGAHQAYAEASQRLHQDFGRSE